MSGLGRVPASSTYDDERAEFYANLHRESSFQPLPDDVCMDCLGRRDGHGLDGFRNVSDPEVRESMTWAQRFATSTMIVCSFRYLAPGNSAYGDHAYGRER